MTLLTSIVGGGSSGGGSTSVIGDLKQVMTGNVKQVFQSNTITDSSGGVWIRAGQVYQQSSYPELFAKIGFVNATIGMTKTAPTAGFIGTTSMGYSPDDDLYVFGWFVGTTGQVAVANSSLSNFVYKSTGGPNYIYSIAYGGNGGNQRFILISNNGTFPFYSSNQTMGANNTTNPDQRGIISANGNTFITWNSSSGNMRISTNSGATWGTVNSNTLSVADVVWGNIGGANGSYIITSSPGWVETSTDGIRWSGIQTPNNWARFQNKFALGTANIYVATFVEGNPAANTVQGQVYTSTDARYWEYRGLLPYNATSNNVYGVGGARITAVGNGANTLIASTDFLNVLTDSIYHYTVYGCAHHHVDGTHHQQHACDVPVGSATAYNRTSSNVKYNRIYTANAITTNTPASNLYAAFANAVPAHNNYIIQAFGYGYANNATYYAYGTNIGNVATSTDGYTWVDRGASKTSTQAIQCILYGTANSTNTFMFLGNTGTIVTTQNLDVYTTRTTAYATDAQGWGTGAFGNANGRLTYVLGGNTGNLIISLDGVQFSGMNTFANVNGVAFGNNRFVAALPNGVAKYSNDGIFWSNTGSIVGTANDLYAIASDNTKFVYAGQGGRVGYIYDVTGAWTNATITTSNDHYGLSYGGGLWVMGGKSGSMFTSTDGITWTYRSPNTNNTILTTFYANNTYFYGGDNVLATSTDAITWITRNPGANYVRISSLAYGNGVYVYGGQGIHGRSTDGITWTTSPIGSRNNANTFAGNTIYTGQINDTNYNNNVFVSVGLTGVAVTSPDGNTWTVQNTKTDADFTGITYGNGRFLAVGSNGVAKISPNGVLWSGHASNANVFSIAYYQNNVNTFILVGAARYGNTMNANVAYTEANGNTNLSFVLETSNDGIYWSTKQWKTPLPPGSVVGGNTLVAIMDIPYNNAFSNILPSPFNASHNSYSRISVSNDTITWSGVGLVSAIGNTPNTITITSGAVPQISYGNGRFFAVANAGTIAVSNDGVYWTTTNIANQFANTPLYSITQYSMLYGGYGYGYGSTVWQSSLGAFYPNMYYTGRFASDGVINYSYGYYLGNYKLRYHGASNTYILPTNIVNFTSKDLVTWTVRPAFTINNVDGPLVMGTVSGATINYANNANNYVSVAYDVSKEFYVPYIFPYTLNYQGVSYGNTSPGNSSVQTQSTGDNVELVWYIKAKT